MTRDTHGLCHDQKAAAPTHSADGKQCAASHVPVFLVSIETDAAGVEADGAVEGVMDGDGTASPPASSVVTAGVAACA